MPHVMINTNGDLATEMNLSALDWRNASYFKIKFMKFMLYHKMLVYGIF
jgi:hypothetical protein